MTLSAPLTCNYYLTLRCNDTCEFCEVWKNDLLWSMNEAPVEAIIKNLEDLKHIGVRHVDFTGGEPLLRPDLPQILKAAKEQGLHTTLTTNGILFKDRMFEIMPYIDDLLFSLDSPDAEEHDRIRGTACFQQVIDGISLSKKHVRNVMINFTMTRESIILLPEMVDLAQKLDVLLWINPVFRHGGTEGLQRSSIPYITRYSGRKNVAYNLASLDLIKAGGNDTARPSCRAADSVITILPDDRLAFPCFYKQEFSDRIEGKLRRMYAGGRVQREHRGRQGRFDECKGCLAWPYMNPSFLYRFDKRLFLALYSLGILALKQDKVRKGKKI